MYYLVSNNSNNLKIVCTLKDGKTLRLFPKKSVKLNENQLTDNLIYLSKGKNPVVSIVKKSDTPIKTSVPKKEKKTEKTNIIKEE